MQTSKVMLKIHTKIDKLVTTPGFDKSLYMHINVCKKLVVIYKNIL